MCSMPTHHTMPGLAEKARSLKDQMVTLITPGLEEHPSLKVTCHIHSLDCHKASPEGNVAFQVGMECGLRLVEMVDQGDFVPRKG